MIPRRTALRPALVALAVGLAVVAAACSSGGSDQAVEPPVSSERTTVTTPDDADADASETTSDPGSAVRACQLLTEADAAKAFGEPAVPVTDTADECWWESENTLKTVNLVRRQDDLDAWRSGYQNDYWEPNDLGDEGYTGQALDSAVFRVGGDQYEVNIVWSTRGEPELDALELATLAAGRL